MYPTRVVTIVQDAPIVIVREEETRVTTVGTQGPAGRDGFPATTVTRTADATINGHRAVGVNAVGELVMASNDDLQFFNAFLGISTTGALSGDEVVIQYQGELEFSGWAWTPASPIFLSANGQLTQVAPEAPDALFLLIVGFALTPTKMWIEPEMAIEL